MKDNTKRKTPPKPETRLPVGGKAVSPWPGIILMVAGFAFVILVYAMEVLR